MQKFFVFLSCVYTVCLCSLQANEPDLLKKNDISQVMSQILENHLESQEMTPVLLQESINDFINQFDPNRIYLLESEVEPYLHLSRVKLNSLMAQYQRHDFQMFEQLNKIFQSAILRSRELRASIEVHKAELFQLKNEPSFSEVMWQNFAHNVNDLKVRLNDLLKDFIRIEYRQYGESKINQDKYAVIRDFESHLKDLENQYLYVDDEGQPLSQAEQENLFAIHVLKALASSLDAHTSFYQASEARDMRMRLLKQVEGVGVEIKETLDGVQVVGLVEGGPAQKSGSVKVGDIITKIDGKNVEDESFDKVVSMLHSGQEGQVHLEFKRKGEKNDHEELIKTTLNRELIPVNTDRVQVKSEAFGDGIIGIIALKSFYQNDNGVTSENDVREAIKKLQKQGRLKGLILDLRDNGGGFLSQAVKVAGLFVSSGVIVIAKYANGEEKFYRDVDGKVSYDGPLVVLTSKTTASAAEIVSQALQDYGVALVVGDEHSYGKGTIQTQTVTDNRSSSYFKVTVGMYYTVSGKTPQKNGVKSDIVVPSHWSHYMIGEEFLDPIAPGKVSAAYEDSLGDLSEGEKPWFLKYYVPTLQHRNRSWREMIPTLRKNSEYRIAHNKNYQFYLKGGMDQSEEDDDESEWLSSDAKKSKNYGEDDLQLQEAENIVRDMILLHADRPRNQKAKTGS